MKKMFNTCTHQRTAKNNQTNDTEIPPHPSENSTQRTRVTGKDVSKKPFLNVVGIYSVPPNYEN